PTSVARNNNSTRSNSTNDTTSRTTTNPGSTNHTSNTPKKSTQQKSTSAPAPKNDGSVLSAANSRLGDHYVSAGKRQGWYDCSGFVAWAYSQVGKNIPSYTGALQGIGTRVSQSNAKPGDLVFFRNGAHVGIYLGGTKFIGSQTSTGVAVADFSSGYWK